MRSDMATCHIEIGAAAYQLINRPERDMTRAYRLLWLFCGLLTEDVHLRTAACHAKVERGAYQLIQRPNRNMTRAYRLRMAVLWPTSCVGRPLSSRQERGRDSSTLSWAVTMRPVLGHFLDSTSPAQATRRICTFVKNCLLICRRACYHCC